METIRMPLGDRAALLHTLPFATMDGQLQSVRSSSATGRANSDCASLIQPIRTVPSLCTCFHVVFFFFLRPTRWFYVADGPLTGWCAPPFPAFLTLSFLFLFFFFFFFFFFFLK